MKNVRIPLYIALGVAIVGIILGSFLDLQLSTAIASENNYFGLAVSAIGPTLGFATVAVMGGGFVAFAIHGKYHIVLKIGFYILAACCLGVAIKYPAGEWFGINGFHDAAPEWAGYFIAAPLEIGAMVGGYFLFKNNQNKNMWIVFCIIIALLLIALVAVIPAIKGTLHRPRYRTLSKYDIIDFHKWWEPYKEYETMIKEPYLIDKDNFKSCPSGHTAEACIAVVTITFLPLSNEKFKKYHMPLMYGAFGLVVLVAFARVLAAAHFLSDVSWGATIMLVLLIIANEVVMRVKQLQLKQVPEAEENKAE